MRNIGYISDAYLYRVKSSYQTAVRDYPATDGLIWPSIDALRRNIHESLLADSNEELRKAFIDPITTDLFYGVDNLSVSVERDIRKIKDVEIGLARATRSSLEELSWALGIDRYMPSDFEQVHVYPKQPYYQPALETEVLLDRIEQKLCVPLDFGDVFRGDRGLTTTRGVATARAVAALYQAFRVKQELQRVRSQAVLEIGPGMGRTAHYCWSMGIKEYTTIDLPMGVVAQACYLGATLGPDKVRMIADPENADAVQIMPTSAIERLPAVGLVLNVDSMTEMSRAAAAAYSIWIVNHAERFLSINHEANEFIVPDIINGQGERVVDYRRFPHWMRSGYCEEIFSFKE